MKNQIYTLFKLVFPLSHPHFSLQNNGAQQLASEATVYIMLEDVNDEIPLFTEREQETVLEGEPIGTKVTQVNAIDKDGTFPNNQVSIRTISQGVVEMEGNRVKSTEMPDDCDSKLKGTIKRNEMAGGKIQIKSGWDTITESSREDCFNRRLFILKLS